MTLGFINDIYLHLSSHYIQLFVEQGYKQYLLIAFAPLSNEIGLLATNSLKYSIVVVNIFFSSSYIVRRSY